MAYQIEFALRPGAYFYVELLLRDRNTSRPMPLNGVAHSLIAWENRRPRSYDWWGPSPLGMTLASPYGISLASDATGEVTYPAPGVLAIAIPASRFQRWWLGGISVHFDLVAIPANPDFTTLLATGTISFGDRHMSAPRLTLDVYPLYPNAVTSGPSISQYLRALSAVVPNARATMDAAISSSPDDPQRQIFDTTVSVPAGGAFELLAATKLGLSIPTLALIQANALLQIA